MYDEAVHAARSGTIDTVQIAVQHDVVVLTTNAGHRYACRLADEDVPQLFLDSMGADGSAPFEVLPLDAIRAKIRNVGWATLNLSLVLWLADIAGFLPWDTTAYNNLAEREKAQQSAEPRPRGLTRGLLHQLRTMAKIIAPRQPARDDAPSKLVSRQEALRRVLGQTRWDAAAELKRLRPRELEEKLRPRTLENKFIEARPYELERQLLDAAVEVKATVAELHQKLCEADWVTPQSVDSTTRLPSLEELLERAVCVGSDGLVEYWIRAHPFAAPAAAPAATPFPRATLVGGPWATATVPSVDVESLEHGICRLCPHWSALYQHNVYVCKRLATA